MHSHSLRRPVPCPRLYENEPPAIPLTHAGDDPPSQHRQQANVSICQPTLFSCMKSQEIIMISRNLDLSTKAILKSRHGRP